MRISILILAAVFALAMTEVGFAQATLPNDAVNSANNPGSVKDDVPVREQALDCTCRNTDAGAPGSAPSSKPDRQAGPARPDRDAGAGDAIIDCTCGKSTPDTTGALALRCPGQPATVPLLHIEGERGVRSRAVRS